MKFIGKYAKIVDSTNKKLVGVEGMVVDETKNTFVIKGTKKNKIIIKKQIMFEIDNKTYDGKVFVERFHERIKNENKKHRI